MEQWADHLARQELELAKASAALKGWANIHNACLHKHGVTMAKLGTAMDKAKYAMTADMAGGAMAGDDPQVI